MERIAPTLFDRLLALQPAPGGEVSPMLALGMAVARDVEVLLNTRRGLAPSSVEALPRVAASVLGFGLEDFCCRSGGQQDLRAVCLALQRAIETHEPRLTDVSVVRPSRSPGQRGLCFEIRAVLAVPPVRAPVGFAAVLDPTTGRCRVAPPAGFRP